MDVFSFAGRMPRLQATQTPDKSGWPSAVRGVGFGASWGFAAAWPCSDTVNAATNSAATIDVKSRIFITAPSWIEVARIAQPDLDGVAVVERHLSQETEVLGTVTSCVAF